MSRSWSTAMRGGKGSRWKNNPLLRPVAAKAWRLTGQDVWGWGQRESQGFHWVVARVRLQGAFSAIGRSLDFSWGVGYGSFGSVWAGRRHNQVCTFKKVMWFQEWIKLWVKSGGMETDRRVLQEPGVRISVGRIVRCVALAPQCLARVLALSLGAGQLRAVTLLLWAAGAISVK